MNSLAFLLGGVVGMFATVRIFMLLAGVRFGNWRQVVVAYFAAAVAATFIVAVGAADGGPPNFTDVPNQWIGAVVAAALEVGMLYRRVPA